MDRLKISSNSDNDNASMQSGSDSETSHIKKENLQEPKSDDGSDKTGNKNSSESVPVTGRSTLPVTGVDGGSLVKVL